MSKQQLTDKAIDIQGKKYVLVSDRVNYFNETYANGSIETRLISQPSDDIIVIQAIVTPDVDKPARRFIDYAQEVIGSSFINKTSAMENASTSAVGRALSYMGIGVVDSIASVDEITKANNRTSGSGKKATEKQIDWMMGEAERRSGDVDTHEWLTKLLTMPPEDVPVFKVKDAVDLIKRQPYPESGQLDIAGITGETLEGVDLDDVPY